MGLVFLCPFNLVGLCTFTSFVGSFHNISTLVDIRSPRSLAFWRQKFARPDRLPHLGRKHGLRSGVTSRSHKKAYSRISFRVIGGRLDLHGVSTVESFHARLSPVVHVNYFAIVGLRFDKNYSGVRACFNHISFRISRL